MTIDAGKTGLPVDVEHVGENRMLLNMGPQHPSPHGVLRL